jgi:hypothetical protein
MSFDPSGLNRTLGTRPRPSSQLGEERGGRARSQTFGRSREGGEPPFNLSQKSVAKRRLSHLTFAKEISLKLQYDHFCRET